MGGSPSFFNGVTSPSKWKKEGPPRRCDLLMGAIWPIVFIGKEQGISWRIARPLLTPSNSLDSPHEAFSLNTSGPDLWCFTSNTCLRYIYLSRWINVG